jgi:hypothetical protein
MSPMSKFLKVQSFWPARKRLTGNRVRFKPEVLYSKTRICKEYKCCKLILLARLTGSMQVFTLCTPSAVRGNQQKKGWNSQGQPAEKRLEFSGATSRKKGLEFTGAARKKAEILKGNQPRKAGILRDIQQQKRLKFSGTTSSKKGWNSQGQLAAKKAGIHRGNQKKG